MKLIIVALLMLAVCITQMVEMSKCDCGNGQSKYMLLPQ